MSKLDVSPFARNDSKVFRFDRLNQKIEFYQRGTFQEPIYTTKIEDSSAINLSSNRQVNPLRTSLLPKTKKNEF